MVNFVKQDMTNIWAELGDYVAPDSSKITQGWLVEVVPRQYWNWIENRQDKMLAYLSQKGIPEWDSTTEYIINKSYVQHNNIVYKCIQTGTNKDPSTQTAYWKKAFTESNAVSEAVSGLTPAADRYVYFTGPTTAATGTITSFARSILDDANASAVRTTIGAQQADTTLTALSGLATDTNKLPYFTAVDAAAVTDLSAFGRSLIDDADAAAARTTLGLGTISTQDSSSVAITGGSITGITDLAIADGGTGASTAAGARTNLGLGSAAVANVQASATDTTAGRVLTVGAFGLGSVGTTTTNLNAISVSGFYKAGSTATGIPDIATVLGYNVYYQGDVDFGTMTAWGYDSSRVFQRHRQNGTWSTWRETVTAAGQNFTSADLDDLLDAGFYYASNASPVNYPSTYNSGLVIVSNSTSSNVRTQLFFPIAAKDKMFFRTFFNTWGGWQEVFTASNQLSLGTTAASGRTALGLANSATIAATNANTASTIVQRDASGNFSAGTITAALNGAATRATSLSAASINIDSDLGAWNSVYEITSGTTGTFVTTFQPKQGVLYHFGGTGNLRTQIHMPGNGAIWKRSYNGSAWTSWTTLADNNNPGLSGGTVSFNGSGGITILRNTANLSVSRPSVGSYDVGSVFFQNNQPVVAMSADYMRTVLMISTQSGNSCRVATVPFNSNTLTDSSYVCVIMGN